MYTHIVCIVTSGPPLYSAKGEQDEATDALSVHLSVLCVCL